MTTFRWIRPSCEVLGIISLRPNELSQRTSDVFIRSQAVDEEPEIISRPPAEFVPGLFVA
jgi:hypothetical protein